MLINKMMSVFLSVAFICNTFSFPTNDINSYSITEEEVTVQNVYYDNTTDSTGSDRIIVALGDSYSSGEGIEPFYGQLKTNLTDSGDYFGLFEGMFDKKSRTSVNEKIKNEDWLAHRSQYAWSGMLTLPGVEGNMADNRNTNWFFMASSGAVTHNIIGYDIDEKGNKNYEYYIDHKSIFQNINNLIGINQSKKVKQENSCRQYKYANTNGVENSIYLDAQIKIFDDLQKEGKYADYVVMTIGGNDVGFSGIITRAVLNTNYLCKDDLNLSLFWSKKLVDVGGLVRNDLKETYKEVARAAGPQATIIVAGYPELLDRSGKGIPISKKEAEYIDNAVTFFNDQIQSVIKECQSEGINIEYVSVAEEFGTIGENGNAIGTPHQAYSDDAFLNKLIIRQSEDLDDTKWPISNIVSAYSMHPNLKGSIAYAKCVQAKINELEEKKNNIGDGLDASYKKAYLDVLLQNKTEISNYNWQYNEDRSSNPVSLYDICGDGTPELFFITAQAPDTVANLHIYTFRNGGADEIYTCSIDSTAGSGNLGYLLFSTEFSRDLYLFTGYMDSFSTSAYKKLTYDGNKLVDNPIICADTSEQGEKSFKYRDLDTSKENYYTVEEKLLFCLKDIVICDVDFTQHIIQIQNLYLGNSKNAAMSYDEAVLELNDGQMIDNDSEFKGITLTSDNEIEYKELLDDLYILAKAGTDGSDDYIELYNGLYEKYNMYGDAVNYDLDSLGYGFGDIDNDNTDELFVFYNDSLITIYTIVDKKIVNLMNSWTRNGKLILDDGSLYGYGTINYASCSFTHWIYNTDSHSFEVSERYFYDYFDESQEEGFDNNNPWERDDYWYYTKKDTFDKKECQKATYKKAKDFQDYYSGKKTDYEYNTFSKWESQYHPTTNDQISREEAYDAIKNYCYQKYGKALTDMIEEGKYSIYWHVADELVNGRYKVAFRSYTGAFEYYYVDPVTGDTYVTEWVWGIMDEEQPTNEAFNALDYLTIKSDEESDSANNTWKESYISTVLEKKQLSTVPEEYKMVRGYLHDFDSNGIPELIYEIPADMEINDRYIISFKNDSVVELSAYSPAYIHDEYFSSDMLITKSYLGQGVGSDISLRFFKYVDDDFVCVKEYYISDNIDRDGQTSVPTINYSDIYGTNRSINIEKMKSELSEIGIDMTETYYSEESSSAKYYMYDFDFSGLDATNAKNEYRSNDQLIDAIKSY